MKLSKTFKRFWNMQKHTGGFTLVELIVVIAILGILAGIAIPAYSGYIEKAQDAKIITELDAVATAVQAANASAGEVATIGISKTGVLSVTVPTGKTLATDFAKDFKLFFNDCTVNGTTITINNFATKIANTSYSEGASWAAGKWSPVQGN